MNLLFNDINNKISFGEHNNYFFILQRIMLHINFKFRFFLFKFNLRNN